MNKTVYLRAGDDATWDRAKRIAELMNSTVSEVIIRHLRDYVERHDAAAARFEKYIADEAGR